MTYRTKALQATSPNTAAGRCAMAPASVPKTKVHPTLMSIAALITASPQTSDRLQKVRPRAAKEAGTSRAIRTFQSVQSAVRYSLSAPSISFTAGLASAGAGNQRMLVASARSVSVIPNRLRLYAKKQKGSKKRGLMYQLRMLWWRSQAQAMNSPVLPVTITTIMASRAIPSAPADNDTSVRFIVPSSLTRGPSGVLTVEGEIGDRTDAHEVHQRHHAPQPLLATNFLDRTAVNVRKRRRKQHNLEDPPKHEGCSLCDRERGPLLVRRHGDHPHVSSFF